MIACYEAMMRGSQDYRLFAVDYFMPAFFEEWTEPEMAAFANTLHDAFPGEDEDVDASVADSLNLAPETVRQWRMQGWQPERSLFAEETP